MHGYFMEMRYQSRELRQALEYDEPKKASTTSLRRKEAADHSRRSSRSTRLAERCREPRRRARAPRIMEIARGEAREEDGREEAGSLVDDRFASLFSREEFQQDPEALEYKLRNPTQAQKERRNRQHDADEDDDLQICTRQSAMTTMTMTMTMRMTMRIEASEEELTAIWGIRNPDMVKEEDLGDRRRRGQPVRARS